MIGSPDRTHRGANPAPPTPAAANPARRRRELTPAENFLVPVLATALGALRVGIQLVVGGRWGAEATFGLLVLCVGLLGIVVERRRHWLRYEASR